MTFPTHGDDIVSQLTLYPYVYDGSDTWVFDDERTGLKEEAFVLGMSEMIFRMVEAKSIENAPGGIAITFSGEEFAGYDARLDWVRSDDEQVVPGRDGSASRTAGNWYAGEVAGERMEGWLCPALGLYFQTAPRAIYVRVGPLPEGIDPIWHLQRDETTVRRFVAAVEKPT